MVADNCLGWEGGCPLTRRGLHMLLPSKLECGMTGSCTLGPGGTPGQRQGQQFLKCGLSCLIPENAVQYGLPFTSASRLNSWRPQNWPEVSTCQLLTLVFNVKDTSPGTGVVV